MIMTGCPWLIMLFLLFAANAVTTYTGTNNPASITNPSYTHPFTGGANTICEAVLTITPFNSKQAYSALMVLNTLNVNYSSNFNAYLHANPFNNPRYDIENANKGKPQTVQLGSLSAGNVYITVIVFDKTVAFSWVITVTQKSVLTSYCSGFGVVNPLSPFCSSCMGLIYFGAYCNIVGNTLSNNSQFNLMVAANSYATFTIPSSSSQINLQYTSDQINMEVFIQFKYFSDEIAGFVNYVNNFGSVARYPVTTANAPVQVNINSGGLDVTVGVFNHNTNPANNANVNIVYTTQATVNILVIVLGVLGGLLLIALIVAACFIIKRIRSPNQIIHPNSSAMLQRQSQIQQNMLTAEQIQVYFPSVSCRLGFQELQTSSMNLNKSNQQQNNIVDRDCVICLCPVEANDLMKVTYCRHLFHAHCLVEWFKKQRNCPYCRQEYSKSSTIDHYQSLLKQTKKNMLAGVELVQQILRAKIIKSTVLIEDVKD